MTATIIQVADAVVAAIASASLSLPVVPVRTWQPRIDGEKLTEPLCFVYPATVEHERTSRNLTQHTMAIAILYVAPVDVDADGTIDEPMVDSYLDVVDEIVAVLDRKPMANTSFGSIEQKPIVDPDDLNKLHQFTSLVRVTYLTAS